MKRTGLYCIILFACLYTSCEKNSCPNPSASINSDDESPAIIEPEPTPVPITNWNLRTSGTTEDLFDVYFTNNTIGYISGANGTILKTTDGGVTWNPQVSGTTVPLLGIQFLDPNIGYAVGNDETILKTTDGGANWIQQRYTPGSIYDLRTIYMLSNDEVYAGGLWGSLYATTDGGTWIDRNVDVSTAIYAIHFWDLNTGMIGGNFTRLRTTINTAVNWSVADPSPIHHSATLPTYAITDFHFFDTNKGFAVAGDAGNSVTALIKTSNGGASWSKVTIPADTALQTNECYNDIDFDSENHGIMISYCNVTGGNYGKILETHDQGTTWTIVSDNQPNLNKVFIHNDGTVTTIGKAGTILQGIH